MHLRAGCGDVIVSEIPDKSKEIYIRNQKSPCWHSHITTEEQILARQGNIVF